jgi:hypothetical protein
LFDGNEVQQQTENLRKAVKALIPFMKEGFNCARFKETGSCRKKCPAATGCRFLNVWEFLSSLGIPYSEIEE